MYFVGHTELYVNEKVRKAQLQVCGNITLHHVKWIDENVFEILFNEMILFRIIHLTFTFSLLTLIQKHFEY